MTLVNAIFLLILLAFAAAYMWLVWVILMKDQ